LALAAGFYFNESKRGGEIYVLRQPATDGVPWVEHQIAADPVVHRLRWGDLDGDGRKELIHAPIFGPGSDGARAPQPAHLRAYVIPARYETVQVETWKIDETLTVLHGLHVADLDGDGRDELLTASFEGIFRFDLEGQPQQPRWQKKFIAQGAAPASDQAGASRGSSEIAVGKLTGGQTFLAAIEPWHGNQVVVYRPDEAGGNWHRQVLDDTLREGHALVIADFDQDGVDEIVAGWRADGGGLRLYDPTDAQGSEFRTLEIDPGMPVEGLVAADMNADRRLDLVANAGRKNALAWYENKPQ
jgi:hypothetical protein